MSDAERIKELEAQVERLRAALPDATKIRSLVPFFDRWFREQGIDVTKHHDVQDDLNRWADAIEAVQKPPVRR